ncbi:MAG: DUF4190 domain-containing protein [Bifidobacteriaceae bacterium]|jgi:hypothetical protein|nr:DUF4190 domain-containing protein [Bifidobacteriaceae bacterium]
MVLGIVGLTVLPLIASIIAVVLGNKGKRAADEGRATNRGMATAGVITGWIGIGLGILGLVCFILLVTFAASNPDVWNTDQYTFS